MNFLAKNKTKFRAVTGILVFGGGLGLCLKLALEQLLLFIVQLIASLGGSDMVQTSDVLLALLLLLSYSFLAMLLFEKFKTSLNLFTIKNH